MGRADIVRFNHRWRGHSPPISVAEGEKWYAFLDIFPRTSGPYIWSFLNTGVQRLSDP